MKAIEARKLSEKTLHAAIEKEINYILGRINEDAAKGKTSVNGVAIPANMQYYIAQLLIDLGYKVVIYKNHSYTPDSVRMNIFWALEDPWFIKFLKKIIPRAQ